MNKILQAKNVAYSSCPKFLSTVYVTPVCEGPILLSRKGLTPRSIRENDC